MTADDSSSETCCWADRLPGADDAVGFGRLRTPEAFNARNVPPDASTAAMIEAARSRPSGHVRRADEGTLPTRVTGCSNHTSGVEASGDPAATRAHSVRGSGTGEYSWVTSRSLPGAVASLPGAVASLIGVELLAGIAPLVAAPPLDTAPLPRGAAHGLLWAADDGPGAGC